MSLGFQLISFASVALIGWSVMWYKKNRKRIRCQKMKRRLIKHPSDGTPSNYLIDTLEKDCKDVIIHEGNKYIYFHDISGYCFAGIFCKEGILKGWVLPNSNPKITEFITNYSGKPEWEAVASLMDCGDYCFK